MSQATLPAAPYRNSGLFAGYYLDERVAGLDEWDCDEAARECFEALRSLWEQERELVDSYNEDELLDAWIDEVLDVLGFGTLSETTLPEGGGYNDRLLFDSAETRREAAGRKRDGEPEAAYGRAAALLEAKQWDADFGSRFSEARSYRDASHQTKYYLEHTPERLRWGVLTNGRKWRLYGTKDYATETYYEVDLPELLESGDLQEFKYFYLFFRPAAFRETAGSSFLDTVWTESETAAQELGEDLQDNVFTALRVLGEGFVATNDLDVAPGDEERLAELKEQSLVLLYRLMFVLYAESRNLIHPEDPADREEYREHFSLDGLRLEVHDAVAGGDRFADYSEHSTAMWSRLSDLFRLVDEGEASLGIPAYNGGLFDDEQHAFLAENQVADRYLAEVVYRLGTTETGDGSFALADYADLDTRHLGSIYEGLLEHEFRVAPEEYAAVAEDGGQVWKPATEVSVADAVESVEAGELYVVNDEGERKATGAYYTPDYVVSYIVEETVDPLLDDIEADLREDGLDPSEPAYFRRYWQRVLDLKILDPAMGSGHFLTAATGYLTERVMEVVREQEIQGYDEQDLRREVAKECIYGVDVNGMAVELAKLSMWLETLAADKPLAFLDHHLKTGNSLVGSDITEVLSEDTAAAGGQLTLTQAFARVRQSTLEHVMDLTRELLAIDNDRLDDIKSMEELYAEIRADPLYRRLFELANVHTAERFGLDVPEDAYDEMAEAIEDESAWAAIREADWFRSAQAMAEEEQFFHWELEFPAAFFDEDGEKREDAGFDGVVSNPPYVRMEQIKPLKNYLSNEYAVHGERVDLYAYFLEQSLSLTDGVYGVIVSNKWMKSEYGEKLRAELSKHSIRSLLDFGDLEVFPGVSTYPCVLIIETDTAKSERPTTIAKFDDLSFKNIRARIDEMAYQLPSDSFDSGKWALGTADEEALMTAIEESGTPLSEHPAISGSGIDDGIGWGIKTGGNEAFVIDEERRVELIEADPDSEALIKPLLKGTDISRYQITNRNRYLIYVKWGTDIERYPAIRDHLAAYRDQIGSTATDEEWYELQQAQAEYETFFEGSKICYPDISKECNFALDTEGRYLANTCYFIPSDSVALLTVLNSAPLDWYYQYVTSEYRGGYQRSFTHAIKELPIPANLSEQEEELEERGQEMIQLKHDKSNLNRSLLDHLGTYSEGETLAEIGLTQPPEGAADSVLQQTAEQKPNLRVGEATVARESENTVEIRLTARYKPEEEDAETDQWGYAETDPLPALRITDLAADEADLIEAFVPVAVEKADGFAGFRDTATKTNSPVDRLRALTLPRVADAREGLQSYVETEERAAELDAKIERTDDLIDEIVYELYGLTEEEREIVESA